MRNPEPEPPNSAIPIGMAELGVAIPDLQKLCEIQIFIVV